MCQEELVLGCLLTVILNNTQDEWGFSNYSRVFISPASVWLLTQHQLSLQKVFSKFLIFFYIFTVGGFCHETDNSKVIGQGKILI